MFISLIILFGVGFFLFSFFSSLCQQLSHKKCTQHSKIPATSGKPRSYPLIGCLISFYKNRCRLLDWYTDLLSLSPTQTIIINRFGAQRTIVTANPANVEHVLKSNFTNFPKGKPFTDILGDLLGCGIFNVDGELWSSQRKLASHEFSTKSLREFVVKTLQEVVENRLIPLLENAAEMNEVIDLQDLLRRFAFDVICKVSLGNDPCCMDISKPVPPLVTAFDTASMISAMRGMAPIHGFWKIKRFLNLGSEKTLKAAVNLVHGSVLEIVKSKKILLEKFQENNDLGGDLLSRLLQAGHDEEVTRDMVISFIMAGRDTTSSAMTWLFWLLCRDEKVEETIVHEVKTLLKNGENAIDFEVLKEMKFLKGSLYESMRLYPPVAWDSKHAVADDFLPDGTFVGKGDRVTYFSYGMGRMENLWGNDRFEFKPNRWFDEPVGVDGNNSGWLLKSVSPYKFPVFQAGPRVCLGKEMAFIQMKYVVASVLRRFKIKPVSDENPVFLPLLTAHMVGGFEVIIKKRN